MIKVTARTSKGEGNSSELASGRESIVIWNVILGLLERCAPTLRMLLEVCVRKLLLSVPYMVSRRTLTL